MRKNNFVLNHIRFEFADSSVAVLKIQKANHEESMTLKSISNSEMITSNLLKPSVDSTTGYSGLKSYKFTNEFESFFRSIRKVKSPKTSLNDYFVAKKSS